MRFSKARAVLGLIWALGGGHFAAAAGPAARPKPTATDVHYGPDGRQTLDLWRARSSRPTPLVFCAHGGAWIRGDKATSSRLKDLDRYLAAGISVVAINYRFLQDAYAAGAEPPVKWPMHDVARALQFVRSQAAAWNLDKVRIAAAGDSAGACSSLWLAFHDDLADAKSGDPVARESTRLYCVAVEVAQTSLDPREMKAWTPNSGYGNEAFGVFQGGLPRAKASYDAFLRHLTHPEGDFAAFLARREEILPWIREYSPYGLVKAGAPPVYLHYPWPPDLGQDQQNPTHTANFGLKLQEKLRSVGVACELSYPGASDVRHAGICDYLIDKLAKPND